MVAVSTHIETGCQCAVCQRRAELFSVLSVLQIDAEQRRQQIEILTAELRRSKANAADLAAQLDQQRQDYWRAADAANVEAAALRDEINYWRTLANSPTIALHQAVLLGFGSFFTGFLAAFVAEVWR